MELSVPECLGCRTLTTPNTCKRVCLYFRYSKCRAIGMERSWVMSEEERSRILKQRAGKKVRLMEEADRRGSGIKDGKRELQPYEPDPNTMLQYMTAAVSVRLKCVTSCRPAYSFAAFTFNSSAISPSLTQFHFFFFFFKV